MDLPTRFGKYELLEHLASGGMAEVYLARAFGAEGFEKRLVIKRIRPTLARSQRFSAMFVQEAKISAGLSHPNIVQIFELGRAASHAGAEEGDLYIAMEHVWGRDLTRVNRALRADERTVPVPQAAFIAACVLRGLAHAHARRAADGRSLGLVHRDVSPHNIMIGFHGEVKLFDFGIARLLVDREDETRSVENGGARSRGGKVAYMSPEQLAGRPLDGRSDIFAAGICLYEMLVGHRLFGDADPDQKVRRIEAADVPDPREENPEIPDALWAVLSRMLARDPDDRHADAGLAEEDLWAFLYGAGLRSDAASLAVLMDDLFPGAAKADPSTTNLLGLAEDLARVGESEHTGGSDSTGSSGAPATTGASESGPSGPPRLFSSVSGRGERRPVVVLVAEVCGFTEVSLAVDPQQVARDHYKLLRRVRRVVDRYGGVIDRYQDDSFLVFFGVPRAHENDQERALACALHLLENMEARRGEVGASALDLSIGIHRGEITLGRRSGRSFRYMARGDTTKLAWRLSLAAEVRQVLVSDLVAELSSGVFRFEPGPELQFKGAGAPRRAHVLVGRSRDLPVARGPWVRRSDELDQLGSAFADLSDGRGGLVALLGPAGTGKSRLLREVAAHARGNAVPFYLGRALSLGVERALSPLRDIVSSAAGLDPAGPEDELTLRLERLTRIGLDEAAVGTLLRLFGATDGGSVALEGEELLPAIVALVRALASRSPLLVAVEDAQFLGASEQGILGSLVHGTRDLPVLYLVASRDPLPASLGAAARSVVLGRLPEAAQRRLVAELLGASKVSEALGAWIEAATEGNALYTAELVKALSERGRVEVVDGVARRANPDEDLSIPPSLEGLIAARLDALDPPARAVLQVAATIGARFSAQVLGSAADLDAPEADLAGLVALGLVERDGLSAEGWFVFSSMLVWEAAGRSLPEAQRRVLHGRVAEAIERIHSGRLDTVRMDLASHRAGAGEWEVAARHALRAGDRLRRQQLLAPAVACWERARSWLEAASGSAEEAPALESELRLKLGTGRFLQGDHRGSETDLQVALDLAADQGDVEVEARALLALGQLHRARGRMDLAVGCLEQAEQAARPALSRWGRGVAVEALEGLGRIAYERGEGPRAESLFRRAQEVAGGDGGLRARALLGLAGSVGRTGDDRGAVALLEEALHLAEAAGDRILQGRIDNNLGVAHLLGERPGEALACFRRALDVRKGLGYRTGVVINLHNVGETQARLGEPGRAWYAFSQGRELAREIGWELGEIMNEAWLCYLEGRQRIEAGEDAAVDAHVDRLRGWVERAETMGNSEVVVTARHLLGRLLHHRGDAVGGDTALEAAHDEAVRVGAETLAAEVRRTRERFASPP